MFRKTRKPLYPENGILQFLHILKALETFVLLFTNAYQHTLKPYPLCGFGIQA